MLKLLKSLHNLQGKNASKKFDVATVSPGKSQRDFLLRLVRKNASSYFGRAHRFAGIQSEEDFCRQVPVRDYEEFRPFIKKIIAGEQSILTTDKPIMLTMTSGTTGEPKFIPVTNESRALNANLMSQWLYRAGVNHEGLTEQSSVGIVSRAVEGHTANRLPLGSISGLIYKNIPWCVRRAYAVPYEVFELEDYDERYFALARFALRARVSFIATPNPGTLLRFAQICAANQENLIRSIYDGTLGLKGSKQNNLLAGLSTNLKPQPARAKVLANIVKENGFLKLAECWSDLKLLGCWIGGTLGTHVGKLGFHYGNVPLRDLGYLASEGHFTVPFQDGTASGILAVNNTYFEFVPEESDSFPATTLLPHELEIGRRYSTLITTAAGLYRYKIEDIIEVTGFYNRTPLIKFVRKAGETANITGEKMHVNHFIEAIESVGRRFNLQIVQFRAAPDFDCCRYNIFIEFRETPASAKLKEDIIREIDKALQHLNIEYLQKRKSGRLGAPQLRLMNQGWAKNELRRHIAEGKRDTQFKEKMLCPGKFVPDRAFIAKSADAESRSLHSSIALM